MEKPMSFLIMEIEERLIIHRKVTKDTKKHKEENAD
jgi:hypothetical protein